MDVSRASPFARFLPYSPAYLLLFLVRFAVLFVLFPTAECFGLQSLFARERDCCNGRVAFRTWIRRLARGVRKEFCIYALTVLTVGFQSWVNLYIFRLVTRKSSLPMTLSEGLGFDVFALRLILQGLFGQGECRQVLWIHLDGLQALTGGDPIALHGDEKDLKRS